MATADIVCYDVLLTFMFYVLPFILGLLVAWLLTPWWHPLLTQQQQRESSGVESDD